MNPDDNFLDRIREDALRCSTAKRKPSFVFCRREQLVGLASALSLACSQTPLDVLQSEAFGGNGGFSSAGSGSGVGGVPEPPNVCSSLEEALSVGTYSFKAIASGLCLNAGGPTTVGMTSSIEAFLLELSTNCDGDAWELVASSSVNAYRVRSLDLDRYFDVEQGMMASGTRVILYTPNGLFNQRFEFRARGPGIFQIVPMNARSHCLSARFGQVEIWPCMWTDDSQNWQLFSCGG